MRDVDTVLAVELADDTPPWKVGLAAIPRDTWHAIHADHTQSGDEGDEQDQLDAALVAACVVWEQDGDDEATRRAPAPVEVAGLWPDQVPADGWAALVEHTYRLSAPESWEWALLRLRRAPGFAVEAAVARAYRIPYSTFLGWDPDDRAIAVAQLVEERAVCPGCGVAKRAMRDYDAATVDVEVCVWCEMRTQAQTSAGPGEHVRVLLARGA